MWELDHKEERVPKNRCFWTVVLEKTLESPLDCKEIKPVNPKGDQSWIFIERTDAEAEAPILWPPDAKSWLTGKDPDAGKDWGQKEQGTTEDEMVGWHHQLDGHEFEQAPGDGEGQESLACCSPRGHKELDTTEWLNKRQKAIWLWGREMAPCLWMVALSRERLSTTLRMGQPQATQEPRQPSGDPVMTAPTPHPAERPQSGWKLGLFSHKGILRLATVG